jgi:putative restriction endonuclease
MTDLQIGDLVFSFASTQIRAAGIVQSKAYESPKPDFKQAGSNWSDIGWFAEVEFVPIKNPITPKNHMHAIRPLLNPRYAPLRQNGTGNQGVYLTEISQQLAKTLMDLSDISMDFLWTAAGPTFSSDDDLGSIAISAVESVLQKNQLIKARRGQGLFKTNVRLIEKSCRITGLETPRHLIASHIKPWSASSNSEKLDGANGLLLSPHIDHLFDKGFISFRNEGSVILSRELDPVVLDRWRLKIDENVRPFEPRQQSYLEYHRDTILKI